MIRRWGAVLMAAAGLTIGVGAPAAANGAPGVRQYTVRSQHNQRITFVRTPGRADEKIRATARGPVDGFGTARVVDFRPDPATGRFHGAWELSFAAGTIRYVFHGQARDRPATVPSGPSLSEVPEPAALSVPTDRLSMPTLDEVTRYSSATPPHVLVDGDFTLLGGTGRFAHVAGRGAFHGWTMPEMPTFPSADEVD